MYCGLVGFFVYLDILRKKRKGGETMRVKVRSV